MTPPIQPKKEEQAVQIKQHDTGAETNDFRAQDSQNQQESPEPKTIKDSSLMSIQRYNFSSVSNSNGTTQQEVIESHKGEWVRWDEVKELVERALDHGSIGELRKNLLRLRKSVEGTERMEKEASDPERIMEVQKFKEGELRFLKSMEESYIQTLKDLCIPPTTTKK